MRLIPRGNPLYEDLPTVFLNWEEMSQKLRTDKFSGYILVTGDGKDGIILFREGRISGSLFSVNGTTNNGQEALTKTTTTIHERKGKLSIYSTSLDICTMVEWFIEGSKLYSKMESYFIDFEKFMTIMGEKKTTGLIKINSDEFCEFIFLDSGSVKGHFVDGQTELQNASDSLKTKLIAKTTIIEVFLKTGDRSAQKLEMPTDPVKQVAPTPTFKPPATPPELIKIEASLPEPKVEPIKVEPPKVEAIKIDPFKIDLAKEVPPKPSETPERFKFGEQKEVKPFDMKPEVKFEPPKPDTNIPIKPTATPARPRLDFAGEDIDPFKPHASSTAESEIESPPAPTKPPEPKFDASKFAPPTPKPPTQEKPVVTPEDPPKAQPAEQQPASTVVSGPSGKVAFLLDGIKKVAQTNIGDDILPWLDGQISRMQQIQPNLSKRDLLLLVDEIERYVRTVRQNPTKATKLATQLRHIIESFAANLG
jgi:hypothetical protein